MLYIQFIPVMSLHIYNFKNSYLTIKVKFEKNQKNQKRGKREGKRQQKNEKKIDPQVSFRKITVDTHS